jgi:hypothetical protein
MSKNNLFIVIICIVIIILIAGLIIYMQIKDHFSQDDPMIQRVKYMLNEISPEAASKIRIYKGDKSYTINKRNVYLCLKDKNGEYYSINTILAVACHEISHVLCKSIGHTKEFDEIFKKILKKAEELGYYDPTIKIPTDYCEH